MIFEEQGNKLHILFGTELNSMVCSEIEKPLNEQIQSAAKKHPDLVLEFDLKNTKYITSAFLRLCIFHAKQVGRKNFHLLNLNENVRHVFDVSGLLGAIDLISPGSRFDITAG